MYTYVTIGLKKIKKYNVYRTIIFKKKVPSNFLSVHVLTIIYIYNVIYRIQMHIITGG